MTEYPAQALRVAVLLLCCGLSSCGRSPSTPGVVPTADWAQIRAAARGQTVTMAMWGGDASVNAYMRHFIAPRALQDDGIVLRFVPLQGDQIVNALMAEEETGRRDSAYDVVWINGETFYQLRQIHALYGPFTQQLPNSRYVDWRNPFIAEDFQQPLEGYECPWGNVQLTLITDARRVPDPPTNPAALAAWIHAHPGRFTFDTGFTGMSFLKSLMYAFAARPSELSGPFDAATYVRLRDSVFRWVDGVRPDLWRRGETFPASVAQLNQLFADGEVDFSMSFNDGEVDNRVTSGMFPATAHAFVLHTGMIQNSHYLGIVAHSTHPAAAMVVVNLLISPEAQWRKLEPAVWGDGTVLSRNLLPSTWRARFAQAAARTHTPPRSAMQPYARPEPSARLMIELSRDFRRHVLDR